MQISPFSLRFPLPGDHKHLKVLITLNRKSSREFYRDQNNWILLSLPIFPIMGSALLHESLCLLHSSSSAFLDAWWWHRVITGLLGMPSSRLHRAQLWFELHSLTGTVFEIIFAGRWNMQVQNHIIMNCFIWYNFYWCRSNKHVLCVVLILKLGCHWTLVFTVASFIKGRCYFATGKTSDPNNLWHVVVKLLQTLTCGYYNRALLFFK